MDGFFEGEFAIGPSEYTPLVITKAEEGLSSDGQGVNELRTDIDKLLEEKDAKTKELKDLEDRYADRLQEVGKEVDVFRTEADTYEEELDALLNPPSNEPEPPGPPELRWVLSDYFNLVATVVIVSNILTMVIEVLHKEREADFFWLDQSFMIFYIMELTCKGLLLQRGMLFGKVSVVWWNWLDLIIVATGVLDMWIQPIVVAMGLLTGGGSALKMFSFLRLLRLLRILKIVGMFMKADLTWTEGTQFSLFIMSVIAFNSVLMGFESDIPDFWGWFYVEQMLLVIFSFEIAVRLKRWGCGFFLPSNADFGWNLLDFTIVAGGIVDQWLMPSIDVVKIMIGLHPSGKGGLGQIMVMLRMARLLRILRLVRLIKSIPPLFNLVVGIMQAMQGMAWVMVLTVLLLYTIALLGVKLVSHGIVFGGEAPLEAEAVFPTVCQAGFVLFKAMNGDWGALEPLFVLMPIFQLFFVLYMIISSWAILSILMAVVSENLLNATETQNEERKEEEDKKREERSEVKLRELFNRADSSNNGSLTKEEFDSLIHDSNVAFELKEACDLEDRDLLDLFEYLSQVPDGGPEDQPEIKFKIFIQGLKDENRTVSERSLFRLEKRLRCLDKVVTEVRGSKPASTKKKEVRKKAIKPGKSMT